MLKVLYAVVDKNGNFARRTLGNGRTLRVYENRKVAERWANKEGQSVVELVWDTDREPLYINQKVVE